MKTYLCFAIILLLCYNLTAQNNVLWLKLDSTTEKYGYANTQNKYVIQPMFDNGNEFMSDFTSVKLDSLWGIIDTSGNFKIRPIYNQITSVYRNHFLEQGTENFKFRSIDGSVKYEYLFIPGPFKMISDSIMTLGLKDMPDGELILRVLEMTSAFCHYYKRNRIYNTVALYSNMATKWTIDYILNNPLEVESRIKADKKFEAEYKNGEIDCCGHGPVWYGH